MQCRIGVRDGGAKNPLRGGVRVIIQSIEETFGVFSRKDKCGSKERVIQGGRTY